MSHNGIRALTCDNGSAPGRCVNTDQGLTRSSDYGREGLAMQATRIPERVTNRATQSFTVDPSTGCHISTYSTGSHGYAQIGWRDPDKGRSTMTLVHRVVWEASFGPIPEGMTVDHMCKRRTCCNVEHLRLLSNHENARRTAGRDWPVGRCANGHPNSELQTRPSGKRVCAPCNREWQRRYNAKRKAA